MASFGSFSSASTLFARPSIIYRNPATAPTAGASTPIARTPATTMGTFGNPVAPPRMPVTSTPVKAPGSAIITTTAPASTGDAPPAGTAPTTGTGSETGTQTGSTGTTDTSRLLDLISGAFAPQDITQPYGPQSISDTGSTTTSSGTNPMAILVLAIMAIIGVVWWTHRKKRAA